MDKGVINMTLGEWIKNYRDKHSLSMQEMADMCGFSKAYIGQLEKGINPSTGKPISPTIQAFDKIAQAVGLDLDVFLKELDGNQLVTLLPDKTGKPSSPAKGIRIPVLGRVAAGIPIEAITDVDSGDIAVVLVNGNDATVKQISKSDAGLTLIGWNLSVYTPRTYNKKECKELPVSILGKVVEIRGKL